MKEELKSSLSNSSTLTDEVIRALIYDKYIFYTSVNYFQQSTIGLEMLIMGLPLTWAISWRYSRKAAPGGAEFARENRARSESFPKATFI